MGWASGASFGAVGLEPLPEPAAPPLVDEHHGAGNRHAPRADVHKAAGGLEGQLHARFENDFHPGLQMNFLAGVHRVFFAHLFLLAPAHREGLVAIHFFVAGPLDVAVAVLLD